MAWTYMRPDMADINGLSIAAQSNANLRVVAGPQSSTSGDVATFNGTVGNIQDQGHINDSGSVVAFSEGVKFATITGLTQCLHVDTTGALTGTGADCGAGGGGVTSFTGDGALLSNSGSTGAVTATLANAGAHKYWGNNTGSPTTPAYVALVAGDLPAVPLSGLATQALDTVVMNATGGTASPTAVAMPSTGINGCAGASNALIYNTTTHALGCNLSAGGTSSWSGITDPTGNVAHTMAADTTSFTYNSATGSSDLMLWTDTSSNSGTGIMAHFKTQASSTEIPWQADANGVGWQIATDGSLKAVGGSTHKIQSGTASNSDLTGELSFSTSSTATYSWTGSYTSHPECTVTPQFDNSTNRFWVTYTSTSSFTINFSANVTGNVSYICVGRN
jgi:hypothetical protein